MKAASLCAFCAGPLWLLCLALWLETGCSSPTAPDSRSRENAPMLSGTCADDYDLDFSSVRSYWLDNELFILYERQGITVSTADRSGSGNLVHQVARIAINTRLVDVQTGIAKEVAVATKKDAPVSITRYVLMHDSNGRIVQEEQFPPLRTIELQIEQMDREAGGSVWGNFSGVFTSGTTILGSFDAPVDVP